MNKSIFKHAEGKSDTIRPRSATGHVAASMLGIAIKDLPEVHSVTCRFLSRVYHGVGVINQNKGIEFIPHDQVDSSVTLSSSGITFLPLNKDSRSRKLCVFFNVTDYVAYQTLQKSGFIRLPSDCDAMIMSDVRNFIHISVEGDDYDMIYLYFPNDVLGRTITRTLKDRYGDHAVVCNPLYKGYDNLLQFVKAIESTTNNK